MSPNSSISVLQLLQHQLKEAQSRNQGTKHYNAQGQIIQVPGLGKKLSAAYEQLRNAAEYSEEHLLLQRAVRRFYYRYLSFFTKRTTGSKLGEELIVELTQAGYLQNNSYGTHVATQLQQLIEMHMTVYWQMREQRVARDKAVEWTLDELSVSTEEILNPHYQLDAIAYGAYQHYLQTLPKESYATNTEDASQYEICLYIAVQKALLKSDISLVRHNLIQMYKQTPHNLAQYITFNEHVDQLYMVDLTQKLERTINRHGAPFRILKSLADSHENLDEILGSREAFLASYNQQINKEYKQLTRRLNKGIIKSIAFIFITKIIIGIGIEVPYDLIFVGSVAIVPLLINMLVPPIYMAGLKLGLHTPSAANAVALAEYMDKTLYGQPEDLQSYKPTKSVTISGSTKALYGILFFIPFAITVYLLLLLDFNAIQGIIFFIFLSTASFLGFRLARMIRELEIVVKQRSIISALRDFFYLPFILVGQWISRKYARVNAVAFILDMAIELPLKTIMRLVRQWTRFLNEKHDEMY